MSEMGKVEEEVKAVAKDGKIACAVAFDVAKRLGVPLKEVGRAANRAGVKICGCQLGCFK